MPDPYDDHPRPTRSAQHSVSVGQNIGPLPIWGWGAVLVAGVFLWRRIAGAKADQAAPAPTTPLVPAYTPAGAGGVYLLPSGVAAGGTPAPPKPVPVDKPPVPKPPPPPVVKPPVTAPPPIHYLPSYPAGGSGQAPPGGQCAPGRVLIQGPTGYTCATAQEAITLGKYLASLPR